MYAGYPTPKYYLLAMDGCRPRGLVNKISNHPFRLSLDLQYES
jgi:hypothetical protein